MENLKCAVLTVSDRCFRGETEDGSGPTLVELIKAKLNVTSMTYKIVPDEVDLIQGALKYFADTLKTHLIITSGGTGFAPRDVTPEATRPLIERETPQLTLAMALTSLNKTPFAVLSRAISGIYGNCLIINMPGSTKAVKECFEAIERVLPHALTVINDVKIEVEKTHTQVQQSSSAITGRHHHVCPHRTGKGDDLDRDSPFAMISVDDALEKVFSCITPVEYKYFNPSLKSPMNLPPFRASIKDGYVANSKTGDGIKKVLSYIAAGDSVANITAPSDWDFCCKINTGAAVPDWADAVIQVEDTQVVERINPKDPSSQEKLVKFLKVPIANQDIRPIGCDLKENELLFDTDMFDPIAYNSILESVGIKSDLIEKDIKVKVIITGNEITEAGNPLDPGMIYDSNAPLLRDLLTTHGYSVTVVHSKDSLECLKSAMNDYSSYDVIISTGGVSMGDMDYVKPMLNALNFTIHFGRVNMKPGKPMTFASCLNGSTKRQTLYFGLPGNPVSAYVTFHLFVLPALRKQKYNWPKDRCCMPRLHVILRNETIVLDPRPEYVRATIISRNGKLYAEINGEQMSSRLKSIENADCLLHLPAGTSTMSQLTQGTIVEALILRNSFISRYE